MISLRQAAALVGIAFAIACSSSDTTDEAGTTGAGGASSTTSSTTPTGQGGEATTTGNGGAGGGGECIPGQATFTWTAPNQNEDGTCADDIAGYALLYGEESGNYTHRTDIPLDSTKCEDTTESNECGVIQECTVTIVGLEPQLWYFALIAYNTEGVESAPSNEVSKDLSCPDDA